ncbi:hypothetical protein JXR93_14135 [bacterium]|nr:hypothetical protein [bacterium]
MLFSKKKFFFGGIFILLSACSTNYRFNYTPKTGYKTGDAIILSNNNENQTIEDNSDAQLCFSDVKHHCSSILYHYFSNSSKYSYKISIKKDNKIIKESTFTIKPKKQRDSFYIPNSSFLLFNGLDYFSPQIDYLDKKLTSKKNENQYIYLETTLIKPKSFENFSDNMVNIESDNFNLDSKISNNQFIKVAKEELNKEYSKEMYGKFLDSIDDFDLYYFGNFYRVVEDNNELLSIISISDELDKRDFKLFSFPEPDIKSKIIFHENNPIFLKKAIELLSIDLETLKIPINLDKIYSYWGFLFENSIEKEFFNSTKSENRWFIILQYREFDEILSIRNQLSVKKESLGFNSTSIHNRAIFSSNDNKTYIFFKEDKICIGYNIDPIYFFDYLDKIPLSKGYNKNHKGFVKTDNSEYIKRVFDIFPAFKFLKKTPKKFEYSFWR